jgi:hypothetical protein
MQYYLFIVYIIHENMKKIVFWPEKKDVYI